MSATASNPFESRSASTAFSALSAEFQRASEIAAPVVSHFRLGGRLVRFRLSGRRLAELMTLAFSHLACDDAGPADLTVDLWDEAATGVGRPVGDFRRCFPEHERFSDGVAGWDGAALNGFQSPRLSAILDLRGQRLVGCVCAAEDLSRFEVGKPLQPLMFRWYMAADIIPLHSAMVGLNGRGLLLGGAGGSGKSTTSLLCARAGFDFLGDDYVGLAWRDGRPIAYSFYASAWLEAGHGARLDWLSGRELPGVQRDERKTSFAVGGAGARALAASVEVGAIGLPHVTQDARTTVREISKAEALRRLSASTVLQLPFLSPSAVFSRAAQVVRGSPCYDIALGTDLAGVPEALRPILESC